jgi:hypothetical protein
MLFWEGFIFEVEKISGNYEMNAKILKSYQKEKEKN